MSKKYKIGYVLTSVTYGGLEKVSSCFLEAYDKQKFDVFPIILVRPGQEENLFLQRLEQNQLLFYKIKLASNSRQRLTVLIRCYRRMYDIIKQRSFDLVHSNGYLADILTIPIAKVLGVPCISTCHGFISTNKRLALYGTINRFMLRHSSKIIAVSETIKADLVRSGVTESRIKVIPNSIRPHDHRFFEQNRKAKRSMLNISEDEFVIGYVGRLSNEKGLRYLIQAISMLNQSDMPLKVLVIGEGPERKELEVLSAKEKVEQKIIFAGFQNNTESWFPAMDLFVLPSLTEGTPMALLEALACGIPVVASAVGGVPQVIDSGNNGLLVSPGRPEEIKEAVINLYKNNELRTGLSKAAQHIIKSKYNVENWINEVQTEYLKVLENNRANDIS